MKCSPAQLRAQHAWANKQRGLKGSKYEWIAKWKTLVDNTALTDTQIVDIFDEFALSIFKSKVK